MKYKYPKIKNKKELLILKDIATALEYGTVKADKRIQVTMPSFVVNELDELFPNIDRSRLLTQLAVDLLIRSKKFKDNDDLAQLTQESLHDDDVMLNYLKERENEI
ncbi:hypothetical protein A3K42_01145 [candidate division WWE3 bacterium RBG_13_37_7]|uniref:Uncharacterized protein n=1 Tax=candidate division WWE3 bacterium RBG_13_37_7 TaxID=1802609 RepID=A0A1F4U2W9_UNCKA|nr:MAG: hypothetical protein A3K42_01145 [candidate division WWE3 bacterium RBG_13_37_7]